MCSKAELRAYIRTMKKSYTRQELAGMSQIVCGSVRERVEWAVARTVLLYFPLEDEVDVCPLIEEAYGCGRSVLLPVVKGEGLELRFFRGFSSMQQGAYGIMEPTGEALPVDRYGDIDLVLVPGMAFDLEGHRLGRGRGYYDRLLPLLVSAVRMGVCFPFQLLPEVPSYGHDVVMHTVVSCTGVIAE